MRPNLLHVVVPYFNPIRWESRQSVHREFEEQMLDSGVKLTTVECALGRTPYTLAERKHVNRVRVRCDTVLWSKENIINIGVSRLEEDWEYVAWVDGDVRFWRHDWAQETVYRLQQYAVVQPWEHCYDLGPQREHLMVHNSFCRQHWHGHPVGPHRPPYKHAHSGFAWACTRRAFNAVGGLIDIGILGSGDYHMAMALVGRAQESCRRKVSSSYLRHLLEWQRRVGQMQGNIGYVPGTIEHSWHGRKEDRRYVDRWDILAKHDYDPDLDIQRNSYGVYELSGTKPHLRHDLDRYFRQRNEDSNYKGEM